MSIIARLWLTAILSLVAFPGLAPAGVVDYTAQGNFTTSSPLTIDNLTATAGSGQSLNLDSAFGLGVVGGSNSITIDTNESVLFQFVAGLATGVSFDESFGQIAPGDGLMNLEGLGVGMVSLGTVQYNILATFPFINVSTTFGNVPLSGFRVSGNGTGSGVNIVAVSFTPAAISVPEPTTLILVLFGGFIGLGILSRDRGQMVVA